MSEKESQQLSTQGKWALFMHGKGFKIIPVNGKIPMVKDWNNGGHFKTEDQIIRFWSSHPNANFGIITSGLAVIDVDGRHGGVASYAQYLQPHLKDTPAFTVKTGSASYSLHVYLSDPQSKIKCRTGVFPGIDVKATGGFVVGPGSLHHDGNWYEVLVWGKKNLEILIPPIPDSLASLLSSERPKGDAKGNLVFGGEICEGQRNDALTSYAGTLIRKDIGTEDLRVLLLEKNKSFKSPLDEKEVIQVLNSVERYRSEVKPQPLYREIPPANPFPIDALGEIMANAALAIKESIQAPDAIIGQSLLAAVALAVQPHADIDIHGRTFPTSLFLLSIGVSGERKSAVDAEALYVHREIERNLVREFEIGLSDFRFREEIYQAEKKMILSKHKIKAQLASALRELGEPPQPPYPQILLMEEPTYEGLIKGLRNGRPSIGLFSDEGARMVGGHAMNSDNQLKTVAGLCGLWDAKPISRIRSEDGSVKLFGKRLSLHLMLQPKVSDLLLANEMLSEQGFLSRCLVAAPETNVGNRLYTTKNLREDVAVSRYRQILKSILNLAMPFVPQTNELQPRSLKLRSADEALWIEFHNEIENGMREGGQFSSIKAFASKAADQTLRVAGVLCLFENIQTAEISRNHLEAAIRLMRFYLSEATRLHGSAILDPTLRLAQKFLEWCQRYEEVHLVQIYQCGPGFVRNKASARKYVAVLEAHYWLTKIDGGRRIDGVHREDVWKVNR